MKYKFKIDSRGSKGVFSYIGKFFASTVLVFKNIHTSYGLMTKLERFAMLVLFLTAFGLMGNKFYQVYKNNTVLVPKEGGKYIEVMVGEVKYLNPILAQSDAERSISKLLFSGLVKVSADGSIVPDLAQKYEISTDGKKYTFHLRDGAKFSDGSIVLSQDVADTIEAIKTPEVKSPLNKSWTDVIVSAPDERTVVMDLPNAFGPFIYNCNFGILPAGMSGGDFSKQIIGSGPFAFQKLINKDKKISEIRLVRNKNYFADKPYIENFDLKIFSDKTEAQNNFETNKNTLGLSGGVSQTGQNMDYQSSKRLGLIMNLRGDKLKDIAIRQKILDGSRLDAPLSLGLTTLDAPLQRAKAEELKKKLGAQNIQVEVFYFNSVKLLDALNAKNYELLLYGFDFGYDRDPYTYWHSSQLNNQNYAGWSSKETDIILEDARMISDNTARNAKYDQFFSLLSKEYIIQFFDPITYNFRVKDMLKGLTVVSGTQSFSRYEQVSRWFIEEKRVKK